MTPRPDSAPGRGPHRPGRVPAADHVPVAPDAPRAEPDRAAAEPRAAGAHPEAARADGRQKVIIDGSNVAHAGENGARLATLLAVREHLDEDGYEVYIVADAALRHQIDDREEYERLVDEGQVQQAPAGTDADYFILAFAKELDAAIVSNDRFRDGGKLAEAAKNRQIRFMVVAGEVVLEKRTRRR